MTNSAATATVSSLAPGETRLYDNGAGVTMKLHQHSHVGYRIEVRKDGVMVEGHTRTFETDILAIWRALIGQHRTEQETFTAALPNGVTVAMTSEQVAGVLVHRVRTTQGHVLPEWSGSFAERHHAVEAAARTAAAFRLHKTAEQIERRRNEVAAAYWAEVGRARRNMHSVTRMHAASVELERLADLNSPTGTAALAAVA